MLGSVSSEVIVLALKNFLIGLRSPAAPIVISFERGELIQVQHVDASESCWNLQLQFEQHTTGSQICACLSCGVMLIVCRGPLSAWSQTFAVSCVRPSICTIFEIILQFVSEMVLRVKVLCTFLTEVPC